MAARSSVKDIVQMHVEANPPSNAEPRKVQLPPKGLPPMRTPRQVSDPLVTPTASPRSAARRESLPLATADGPPLMAGWLEVSWHGGQWRKRRCRLGADGKFQILSNEADIVEESLLLSDNKVVDFEEGGCFCTPDFTVADSRADASALASELSQHASMTCRAKSPELTREWMDALLMLDGVNFVSHPKASRRTNGVPSHAKPDTPARHPPPLALAGSSVSSLARKGSHSSYDLVSPSSMAPSTHSPSTPMHHTEPPEARLKRAVRRYINRKLATSDPATFRTLAPPFKDKVRFADYGRLRFIGHANAGRTEPPRFIHLASTREPHQEPRSYVRKVLGLMRDHWGTRNASIVISITGSALDFTLRPRLEKAFKRGLAQAALATNAWIVTGGTDTGVMSLVGHGLAEYNALGAAQCIGIAPWGAVYQREAIASARGETVDVVKDRPSGPTGANLEPHHTLFLLPDTGNEGGAAFGNEITFRNRLEAEYCRMKRVPRVLVVVQGGPGTLQTVLQSVNEDCPVLLIADSGGVAELLDIFLKEYRDKDGKHYMKGAIPNRPEFAKFTSTDSYKKLQAIAQKDWEKKKLHSFRLSETSTSEFDVHMLNAVINDRDQCKPELRLKLAVEWNRVDVVGRVLLEQQARPADMRDALQTAILKHSPQMVKLLLTQGGAGLNLPSMLDFVALHRTGERHSSLFALNARLQEEILDASKRKDLSAAKDALSATSARRYERALSAFLSTFVPNMAERLRVMVKAEESVLAQRERERQEGRHKSRQKGGAPVAAKPRAQPGGAVAGAPRTTTDSPPPFPSFTTSASSSSRAATQTSSSVTRYRNRAPVPHGPGIDDVLLWSVLVRDFELTQATWQIYAADGDPIRMALLAARTAQVAAKRDAINSLEYDEHAERYLGWATAVLERCKCKEEANYVLRRPSQCGWPHTILRIAIETGAKSFVGHRHVQALVDDSWRGGAAGSEWTLPENTSYTNILLHFVYPTIEMIHTETGAILPTPGLPRGFNRLRKTLYSHYTGVSFIGFLAVPQVKFTFKALLYLAFLLTYFLHVADHGRYGSRPHTSIDLLDVLFYTQVLGLWFDEVYSWVGAALRGDDHLDNFWNKIDIGMWTSLLVAAVLHVLVVTHCQLDETADAGAPPLNVGADGDDLVLRRLAPAFPAAVGGVGAGGRRGLKGGDPVLHMPQWSGGDDVPTREEVFADVYAGCTYLFVERTILAVDFILATTRLLQWMLIPKKQGVLTIIFTTLVDDVVVFMQVVFMQFAAMCLLSFGSALVALMPLHGSGAFAADGAFFIPWWALYGEFGEIELLGINGGVAGATLTWVYTFVVQIVLVNLLIAMMTDTYQRIQANADNEWKFMRVGIVDEFATAFYLPPPLSLPYTMLKTMSGARELLKRRQRAAEWDGDDDDDDAQLADGNDASADDAASSSSPTKNGGPARFYGQTRLLDAVSQEAVVDRLNPSPELLWMQAYLEDEETHEAASTDNQLHELVVDRERSMAKALENQELLESLKTTVEGISGRIERLQLSSEAALDMPPPPIGEMVGESRLGIGGSAGADATGGGAGGGGAGGGGAGGGGEAAVSSLMGVRDRLEEQLRATKHKYDELVTTHEKEVAELKLSNTQAQRQQKGELSRLKTQLQHFVHLSAMHTKARGKHPLYPARGAVPDECVAFRVPFDEYAPTVYTAQVVRDNDVTVKPNGWADPVSAGAIAKEEWNQKTRKSFEGVYPFDTEGRPLNPRGRTGMVERGLLGKWGPNHAADPVVTRYDPERPYILQMVAIQRRDTSDWAIPGGMVDLGESVSLAVRREFTEEAGALESPEQRALFLQLTEELFANGDLVTRGYVDDPRNTDNAWMETCVYHFHCTMQLGTMLPLHAGDDAVKVKWLDVDTENPAFNNLYASHREFVIQAVEQMGDGVDVGGGGG